MLLRWTEWDVKETEPLNKFQVRLSSENSACRPCFVTAEIISLGGFEEDQCVILGVGRHVTIHQHQPAMAAWRAQWLGVLCLPGESASGWPQSQPLHVHHRWSHLWKTHRYESKRRRSAVKKGSFTHCTVICVQQVQRVWVLAPVRRPAPCVPAAPTAPASLRSVCGAAALSAVLTPQRTSSPSPTASVWSGRPRTVRVRHCC